MKTTKRQLDEGGNHFEVEETDEEGNTEKRLGKFLNEGKTIYQEE